MAPVNETTQFSMVEYRAYEAEGMPIITDTSAHFKTPRHKAMAAFASYSKTDLAILAITNIGGIDNLQRVRVFGPAEDGSYTFVLVPKLPVHVLERKKVSTEAEAIMSDRKKVLAESEAATSDPKKLKEFLTAAIMTIIGRAGAALLLTNARPVSPQAKKRHQVDSKRPSRKDYLTSSAGKGAAFDAALKQDIRNRRDAAKKAAAEFRGLQEKK